VALELSAYAWKLEKPAREMKVHIEGRGQLMLNGTAHSGQRLAWSTARPALKKAKLSAEPPLLALAPRRSRVAGTTNSDPFQTWVAQRFAMHRPDQNEQKQLPPAVFFMLEEEEIRPATAFGRAAVLFNLHF